MKWKPASRQSGSHAWDRYPQGHWVNLGLIRRMLATMACIGPAVGARLMGLLDPKKSRRRPLPGSQESRRVAFQEYVHCITQISNPVRLQVAGSCHVLIQQNTKR